MTIAHIIFSFGIGGIETMLVNIANAQSADGHDVTIYVINNVIDAGLLSSLSTSVHVVGLNRHIGSRNPMPLLRLNAMLLRQRPDIIHLHTASIVEYLFPPLRRRCCATLHTTLTPQYRASSLFKVPHRFSISDAVRDDLQSKLGLDSQVVNNGVSTDRFARRTPREGAVGRARPFRIVCVSRLIHECKGQHVLIEAIALLRDKGYDNITLDLFGEGPSRQFLTSLIESRRLGGRISLKGNTTQEVITQNLCCYDLLVQPSMYEGFGLTVAEAMAADVPVLVSSATGTTEVVDGGRCGHIFTIGDAADCADNIERLINNPDDTDMLSRARQRARELYDVSGTARRYIKAYAEIIGECR